MFELHDHKDLRLSMRKVEFSIAFCLFLLIATVKGHYIGSITSLDDLDVDENQRLRKPWILHTKSCEWHRQLSGRIEFDTPLMDFAEMSQEMSTNFLQPGEEWNEDICIAVRLVKGTLRSHIYSPLSGDKILQVDHLLEWTKKMLGVEIGWVSYWPGNCLVYWINFEGKRVQISTLQPLEKNTFWTKSFLGHEFEITDQATGEFIGHYVAEYDSFFVVGEHVLEDLEFSDPEEEIRRDLNNMYWEPNQVKRTFSTLGFKKGKLPEDVWTSISAYYYNNRHHLTPEEQIGTSVFINWWESPCYFIGMPWGLKGRWQDRLQTLVQTWIGWDTPLERTDIYGIRQYTDGARLLTHVDRIETHAVSLIINVAQEDMKAPWMVEIYDFAGRLHEIEMQPGDVVYYEVLCILNLIVFIDGICFSECEMFTRANETPEWVALR